MNRFRWWAMSVFSSLLVWMSLVYNFYENASFGQREVEILCLYTPTIILSVGGILTSMFCKGKPMKPWIESIIILLNLVVWIIIGIATLIGTSTAESLDGFVDLVVESTPGDPFNIGEPNIYFFSFGSLFNAVFLASSGFQQYILKDERTLTTTQWTFLAASGLLVMATGISLSTEKSCNANSQNNDDIDSSCSLIMFSIFVGLISGVTGCVLVPWTRAPLKCQAELALLLMIIWGIAIGLLTFGTGPAVNINTMYLGIFLSFHLAMNIFSTTLYANAVFEATPFSQIEFERSKSQQTEAGISGAAGILDLAYTNLRERPQILDEDPRSSDQSITMLFESVGGSLSSMDVSPSRSGTSERIRNHKVVVGRHEFSRIEIWFLLFVESSVCLAVFHEEVGEPRSKMKLLIVLSPTLSIILSLFGWFTCSIKKRIAYHIEGVLILACITVWIVGLIAVTEYFKDDTTDVGGMRNMTANQLFMSYGSFFTSLYLLTKWLNASVTTTDWIFLSAASATIFGVIFISNNQIFRKCRSITEAESCGDLYMVTMLALSSACIAFVMVFVSFAPCPIIHVIIGTPLLLIWCAGAYFFIFEKEGVGSEIGPIFFACWGSLFFCIDITATNLPLLGKRHESDDEVESALSQNDDEKFRGEEENPVLKTNEDAGKIHDDDDDKNNFEHPTEKVEGLDVTNEGINADHCLFGNARH